MGHGNTKLSGHTRLKMVMDYLQVGKSAREMAEAMGISRKTFYYWLKRYLSEGEEGLRNRRSGPRSSPRRVPREVEARVLTYRRLHRVGPARMSLALGVSASTIYVILRRHGENHLRPKAERIPAVRYEREYPGALVHVDVKVLPALSQAPKEYQFTAVDDYSRQAYAAIFPSHSTKAACDFLQRAPAFFDFPVERVMTDNSLIFTMRYAYFSHRKTRFERLLESRRIKHLLIRPNHPETNGKVERFHRTVEEELFRVQTSSTSQQRQRALASWLHHYNNSRPHLGIGGLTPSQRCSLFFAQRCHQVA